MLGVDTEIEAIKASVSRYFPITQIVVNPFALTFHVAPDPRRLDSDFDALRQELVPTNYVPSIVSEKGEVLIHVQKRAEPKFRGAYLNLLLLVATIGTTSVAGAVNWSVYANVSFWSLEAFAFGIASFTVPLLLVLGAHEMGHYFVAKRHRVRASLPFFIPSVPFLGTFGAFISMRDPIPNRRALLEIGISGPLVGFVLAVPITIIGLFLSAAGPRAPILDGGGEITTSSPLYGFLQTLVPESVLDPFRRHPTAFAGWVGLFVTAINLLPAGQLDGGHVARALVGEKARYLSWGAVFLLLVLGVMYAGWFLFALIILLLGARHPPPLNDITRLRPSRKALGILAFVVLALTFVPQPFIEVPTTTTFAFETADQPYTRIETMAVTIPSGSSSLLAVNLNNTGNVPIRVRVGIDPRNLDNFGWTIRIHNYTLYGTDSPREVGVDADETVISLNVTEYATVRVSVVVPSIPPDSFEFTIWGRIVDTDRVLARSEVTITATVS